MSRFGVMGASLVALIAATGVASAADLYNPPPAAPAPAMTYNSQPGFSWNGPYMGLIGGYGWGSSKVDGWTGGAYAGYNFQVAPSWVVGVEGDVTASGMEGSSGGYTVKNPWDSTLRMRAGYSMGNFLFYGTGGLALGEIKGTDAFGATESDTKVGWTAGAGIEAALANNMTARVEYRHIDLGSSTMSTLAGSPSLGVTSDEALVGVGMKF